MSAATNLYVFMVWTGTILPLPLPLTDKFFIEHVGHYLPSAGARESGASFLGAD